MGGTNHNLNPLYALLFARPDLRQGNRAAIRSGARAEIHRRTPHMGRAAQDSARRHHYAPPAARSTPHGYESFNKKDDDCVKVVSSVDACRSRPPKPRITGASSCIGLQLAHESAQNGTSACDHGTCEAELHAFAKSSPLNVTIRVSARDFEQSDAAQKSSTNCKARAWRWTFLSITQVTVSTANGGNCNAKRGVILLPRWPRLTHQSGIRSTTAA